MSQLAPRTAADRSANDQFEFGENWSRFLSTLDDQRVLAAQRSLQELLHRERLESCRFLDAGSGSGLFSLAAHQLGAEVTSFDLSPKSVACANTLKQRFCPQSERWTIQAGSLADRDFLGTLGEFEIVYCWGVAHHTGDMWGSITHLLPRVKPGGLLVLAIYNDQLYVSRLWHRIKRIYQQLPRFLRPLYVAAIGSLTFLKRFLVTLLATCFRLLTFQNPCVPFLNWARESQARGMHGWYDLVDWVGGWPFEVAKPEEVFRFLRDRGFALREMTTSSGHGCNEFVFLRTSRLPWDAAVSATL